MERLRIPLLNRIISFLHPEDIVRLGRTSRRMHAMMPEVTLITELWKGPDFDISSPNCGHCHPKLYFDGPILPSNVKDMELSVVWREKGHGDRNGKLFMKLMRPTANGEPKQIAEHPNLFGFAEHHKTKAYKMIRRSDHPVVAKAKAGDFYRFMRDAGSGEAHRLKVKNFQVQATVYTVVY